MVDGKGGQIQAFGEWWEEEWQDAPEFVQEDQTSYRSLVVHFATAEDLEAFSGLIGQPLTFKTRSIWYPKAEIGRLADKRYIDEEPEEGGEEEPERKEAVGIGENGKSSQQGELLDLFP